MNAVIAVQDLIKTNKERIKALKAQLDDFDSGREKASAMKYASTENAIEQSEKALEKHTAIYEELLKKDVQEVEKEERIKKAIERKNYFKFQKLRIKRSKDLDANQKLEAMMIIDELPHDVDLEDDELLDIASTTLKLDLRVHDELEDKLTEIKEDFENLISKISKEGVDDMGMLRTYIPILVLHFYVLVSTIEEELAEQPGDTCFRGLPRYQDWWIAELWQNHQAYFGLYKWKDIVTFLCLNDEQKLAWETIFSNWVFIKKVLCKKGELAYEFNFAFDTLMDKYAGLEEELNVDHINSMDKIVRNITGKEDFHKFKYEHNIITKYYTYKKERIESK